MDTTKLADKIESISANYAKHFGITRDSDWFVLKLQEELGELIQSYLMMVGQARQKGKTEQEIRDEFENEVADVFAHVLLLARHFQVNLDEVFQGKWMKWNKDHEEPL